MKSKSLLLSVAAISLSCVHWAAQAGSAVFYITEDGSVAEGVSVDVNGKRQLVDAQGFTRFELDAGSYSAELSQYGTFIGEAEFSIDSQSDTSDVFVEILGGEAIAEEVSSDTTNGVISGQLSSRETGGSVSGARVSVVGTDIGAMTNDDGSFSFELPRGEYEITIAHPSYERKTLSGVYAIPGVPVSISPEVGMSGSGVIEEVVAVGTYIPDSATSQERDSSAVLDSIGAEQMSQFGDSSAASALKRVAGVSVVGGQFAVVRGLQGRYISSTLNGGLMPSTDPMKRDVPLDLFPASVLGSISIQKSFTPNLPGDTTGGVIMMATKDLPDGPTQKISATLGMNTRTTGSDVAYYDGGSTDFLGIDDGGRDIPASILNVSEDGQTKVLYVENSDQGFCNDFGLNCVFPEKSINIAKDFDHNYKISDASARPEIGFSYLKGNLIATSYGDIGYYGAIQYKDKWTARHDAEINDFGVVGSYERTKRSIDTTGYFVVGFEDEKMVLNSKTILLRKTDNTVKVANERDDDEGIEEDRITLQWVERQFLAQHFLGEYYFDTNNWIDWRINLGQSRRDEPDRRSYAYRNDLFISSDSERRYSELVENSLDLGLDYTHEYMLNSTTLMTFKIGAMASEKDREVNLVRTEIEVIPGAGVDLTLPVEDITSDENIQSGSVRMQTKTTNTDSYTATDSINALYTSLGIDFGSIQFMGGVRSENSEQILSYPNDDESVDNVLESSNLMPMLSGTFRATEDLQFRAAISQTISRPGITERSESRQYDPETDEEIIGAPDLEISTIDNLDVRAEYYFSESESISLAWFNKLITAPIERTIPDGSGSAANGVTFRNEDSATISGLELDFSKDLISIRDVVFSSSGNISLIDAEVVLSEGSARFEGQDTRRLQGQSEVLGNFRFGLEDELSGQSLNILVNHSGDRIAAASRSSAPEFEEARTVIDLVYRWDTGDYLEVKAKLGNLTDSPVEYTRDNKITEKYFEGTNFNLSLSYEF
ncbi:MAG: TonB-dependent receptor [Oceanobacter sp.]|nr:MAG: TonB-dependent receptor [Oceanobacter sp.]